MENIQAPRWQTRKPADRAVLRHAAEDDQGADPERGARVGASAASMGPKNRQRCVRCPRDHLSGASVELPEVRRLRVDEAARPPS